MFKKGDKIIYGQTGVCIVEDICEKILMHNTKKLYYTLKPLYQNNNVIYAPGDNPKLFMRAIITRDEAEQLIKNIPEIREKALEQNEEKDTVQSYKAIFETHQCNELIEIIVKIYAKKQLARTNKKKIGFIDEKNIRKAEDLLFGELAVALEIDPDKVQKYITGKLSPEIV